MTGRFPVKPGMTEVSGMTAEIPALREDLRAEEDM
jgi:hypothetical protein